MLEGLGIGAVFPGIYWDVEILLYFVSFVMVVLRNTVFLCGLFDFL